MKDQKAFYEALALAAKSKTKQDFYCYMEDNIASFFASSNISDYYKLIKAIDISDSDKALPKLIKAWLAFLCGDNAALYGMVIYINESELKHCHERSFYYSLKALMGFQTEIQEKERFARLAIDVLPEGDSSFYMANAKMTCAQILAGLDQYRNAAVMFKDSYLMFYRTEMHFPAAVALANYLLNLYKLGEFIEVINESSKALLMSVSFGAEAQEYWDVVHLPLGMCYYEMNKPSLAIQHLKKAKQCIDNMKLLHMHGLIELYLFKSYFVMKDKAGMEEIKKQALNDFGNMHYVFIDLMQCLFNILSSEQKLQSDIERLEMEYVKDGSIHQWMLLELLCYLKLTGMSSVIEKDDIIKGLERLRFIGMIPYLQMFLIFLAEMYFTENRKKDAEDCLREAVGIYKDYGICVSFYCYPLKSSVLLEKLTPRIYLEIINTNNIDISNKHEELLSAREKEIIQLVAMGKSNKEISEILYIGVGTIKWHLNHIFSKLEVNNRIKAVEKAKSLGEIEA